jgi:polyhydroxyalkanoate synthase
MSKTFSFLRAKDLVYGPAVRSYMMGEAPPAFDLLYWNGDSTNLPGKMAVQYLRGCARATNWPRRAMPFWDRPCA